MRLTAGLILCAGCLNWDYTFYNLAFVTAQSSSPISWGESGDGADQACQAAAQGAGLPGRYVAWVSTTTVSAAQKVRSARGWLRTDRTPFADLLPSEKLFSTLGRDERGTEVLDGRVLTGTEPSGIAGANCENWSVDAGSALSGTTVLGGVMWASSGSTACGAPSRLFCFGVSQDSPLADPGSALTSRDYLYVIGGIAHPSSGARNTPEVRRVLLRPTGELGNWESVLPLPTSGVAQGATLTVENSVLVTGGENGGPAGTPPLDSVYRTTVQADGSLETWTVQALGMRRNHCAVTANGYLYLIGGQLLNASQQLAPTDSILRTTLSPDGTVGATMTTLMLPSPRSDPACAVHNGTLYVFGGNRGAGFPLPTVERAALLPDGTLGPWMSTAPLPVAASGPHAAAFAGKLLVVGGNPTPRHMIGTPDSTGALTWTVDAINPPIHAASGLVLHDSALLLVGGRTDAFLSTPVDTVHRAVLRPDGTVVDWTLVAKLPEPLEAMGVGVLRGL